MNAKSAGRPKLPDDVAKRHPLNMKCTAKLRAQLMAAAEISGRNLSAEVEYRLEQSFLPDDVLIGSVQTQALLKAMSGAIEVAERATGKDWNEDPQTAGLVHQITEPLLPNDYTNPPMDHVAVARTIIIEALKFGDFDAKTISQVEALIEAKKSRG